jgi:hypothetical protein
MKAFFLGRDGGIDLNNAKRLINNDNLSSSSSSFSFIVGGGYLAIPTFLICCFPLD